MCLLEIRLTYKYNKKRLVFNGLLHCTGDVSSVKRYIIFHDFIRFILKFQCIFEGEDVRALHKDDMNGDERFIYTLMRCEIFGYAYPSRYAHISLSYCPSITTLQRQVSWII